MRFVRHALLAAAASAAVAGGASAQTTGTGTGTGSTGTGSTGTGSTGTGSSGTGSGTGDTPVPVISGATITGTTPAATTSGGAVDSSNFLGSTYSNPYYQGLNSNTTGAPGGFGTTLYGTGGGGGSPGTTSTTGRTGTTGGRTGTTAGRTTTGGANPFGTSASPFGTTGGQGGRGGQAGGGFGAAATSQFGGQVIPLPRNIAYSAVLRFPTATVAPTQRLADVQAVIARSSMMANPAGVTVVQDGEAIVLRGAVASEDEARLAEGMVRLTPGVREVRNELAFPRQ